MSNRVVHFEIPCDDGDRARQFYGDVFGWQLMHMPEMDYTIVSTGPTDPEKGATEPGFINGGMMKREGIWTAPNIVIDVANIEDALKSVGEHGGSTVQERQAVGDMGFAAYFTDPEGNLVGLWETASGG
jgi:uncharacterized protein